MKRGKMYYEVIYNFDGKISSQNVEDEPDLFENVLLSTMALCGGRLFLTILLIIFKWSLIFNVLYKHLSLVIGVSARPRRLFSNSILLYR